MKNARIAGIALAVVALLSCPAAQAAVTRGQTSRGEPFLVGGVGQDEVAELQLAHSGYSLSVRMAARGTGAYLADVHLRIADAQGQPVFEQDLPGPWLLIGLQPGRYTLQASRGAEAQAAAVTLSAGAAPHEQVFYFAVPESAPGDPVKYPPATR